MHAFVIALLLIVLTLLIAVLMKTLAGPTEVALTYLMSLVVIVGVLVALITLTSKSRRESSKDYLDSATTLLERAHGTLAHLDDRGRPKNDRRNWLAAARFLLASERISRLITEDVHRQIYQEQKEYWRGRFHDLISPTVGISFYGFPKEYYAERPDDMIAFGTTGRAPLEEKSLAVIYRFICWPKGVSDPLVEESKFSDEEIEDMQMLGPRGLGELLAEVRELQKNR